jgi:hypothetical protein
MINSEKITLEVHDSDGEPLNNVPDIDVLINTIDKSKRTPLIHALKEKGYIHKNDIAQDGPGIHPAHPMLLGHFTIFQPEEHELEDIVDSPGMQWLPEMTKPKTEPDRWEKVFDITYRMLGKRA